MKNILLALLFLASTALAFDPPPLEKGDAKKILEFMEWREVNILVIQQGVDLKGAVAPIYATIVGLGKRDSRHQQIKQTLLYDKDLGWYHLEILEKGARIWNKDGYREVKPWSTW
jgi:hypothetical protein